MVSEQGSIELTTSFEYIRASDRDCVRKYDRVWKPVSMEVYQEGTSMTKPPRLDSSNYGYWKVCMQAFISGLDEDCWSIVETGWSPPAILDDEKIEVLKPREKWTAAEKKASSCNSKAKTAIYNAIDASYFKLISQCVSAQKAWKTLENMFEGSTIVKQTKLDMQASRFENLRMDEEETGSV